MIDVTDRLFLQKLQEAAEHQADFVDNPDWKRMYLELARTAKQADTYWASSEDSKEDIPIAHQWQVNELSGALQEIAQIATRAIARIEGDQGRAQ